MSAEMISCFDVSPGDHFVGWGPGWVAAAPTAYAGEGDIGGSAERQRFVSFFVNVHTGERRKLPGNGESRVKVIRGWAEANGVGVPS